MNNKAELVAVYDEIFATKTFDEWSDLLTKADIPHERLQHFRDLPYDPQVLANEYMYEHTYEDGTKTVFTNAPVHFSSVPYEGYVFKTSKAIGSDNDEVLAQNGFTAEQIAKLRADKAIK